MVLRIEITAALEAERLDRIVARRLGLGRRGTQALFEGGRVLVDSACGSRRGRKGEAAVAGTVLRVTLAAPGSEPGALPDAALPLTLVLQTAALVIVDKPAGVPSAPQAPGETGTVANALLARFPEMSGVGYGPREPGLCHRLDTGTSGLLLAARTPDAFARLSAALRSGEVDKRYLLVCSGAGALAEEGSIVLPLAPDPCDARRVRVGGDRPRETRYRVLARAGDRALVEATASPAYRHQIRAHFAALGAPLVGDRRYGGEIAPGDRHALHASRIAWDGDGGIAAFVAESDLPAELARLLPR